MSIHKDKAYVHTQETVAKTVLVAAHAKRLAAQGRLTHARWTTRRQRAVMLGQGEAPLATRAGSRGRSLSTMRGAACVSRMALWGSVARDEAMARQTSLVP
jgi:hypothetical protein